MLGDPSLKPDISEREQELYFILGTAIPDLGGNSQRKIWIFLLEEKNEGKGKRRVLPQEFDV